MEVKYNGTTVQNVTYNGAKVNFVYMDGTLVWRHHPDCLSYTVTIEPLWCVYFCRNDDEHFELWQCFETGSCGDPDTVCVDLSSRDSGYPYSCHTAVIDSAKVTIANNTYGTSCTFTSGLCGDSVCFEGHEFTFDDFGDVCCMIYNPNICLCVYGRNVPHVRKYCDCFYYSKFRGDYLLPACFNLSTECVKLGLLCNYCDSYVRGSVCRYLDTEVYYHLYVDNKYIGCCRRLVRSLVDEDVKVIRCYDCPISCCLTLSGNSNNFGILDSNVTFSNLCLSNNT